MSGTTLSKRAREVERKRELKELRDLKKQYCAKFIISDGKSKKQYKSKSHMQLLDFSLQIIGHMCKYLSMSEECRLMRTSTTMQQLPTFLPLIKHVKMLNENTASNRKTSMLMTRNALGYNSFCVKCTGAFKVAICWICRATKDRQYSIDEELLIVVCDGKVDSQDVINKYDGIELECTGNSMQLATPFVETKTMQRTCMNVAKYLNPALNLVDKKEDISKFSEGRRLCYCPKIKPRRHIAQAMYEEYSEEEDESELEEEESEPESEYEGYDSGFD